MQRETTFECESDQIQFHYTNRIRLHLILDENREKTIKSDKRSIGCRALIHVNVWMYYSIRTYTLYDIRLQSLALT